ncbi:calcineurin-binding protein cabin-1-like isoform X2 [Diorhabda sublineata]|uniref:calcineurin-binding protein cabin-1-like isoform X2 n=1 Tax=Diorhabda sublineata TaxID=1163346 RepID=UPI0024E1671D|nr:calcineurin-binding protein cabin-1-like isoform X2 [Diorhabda sublineata]
MLKIKALNRESLSDEDTPVIRREAQEEIVLELYNKALHLQSEGVYTEAESILSKLIDENIPLLENNGGLPKSMSNLKYSCHINMGNIYLKLDRVNDALEKYLFASQLDGTDVTLWYKIGNLSLAQDKFRQSAYAFAKGLECSETHWPCLDKLISVLFAIKDTIACLEYIGKALMKDADYVRGLVLRKQIYRNNPATEEYYKLYNPDSIWEPPLDTPVDDEDEKSFLEEAQVLCDRVIEVENSFAPKPLQTIPLPKPLKEFTWMCLTETIIYIHQYLADNEMSHFTMIDMKKCMSTTEKPSFFKFQQTDQLIDSKIVEDQVNETNIIQENADVINTDEKMEINQITERRVSQNSEMNVNEPQENTPVQTDNDEEQNMDQENEEQDETAEPKERGRPRGSKRKRDVISDLQTWGWYSRRKLSKKAKEKDFTVEDALERIIPKDLLPYRIDSEKINNFEDSMNTMDLYHMYIDNYNVNTYLSPIHSPKSVNYEQYFGTDKENDDVQHFWTKSRDYYDVIVLLKDLVFSLSKLWHYKWPKELVPLYVKAYNMFREHCDPPQVFCGGHTFGEMRNDALASILFGELSLFSCDDRESVPPTLLGYLRLISGWQDEWKEEYPSFFIRVYWLQSHLFRKENNNDLAITALQLIQEVIEGEEKNKTSEKYMLSLPNCFKYGLVNTEIVEKIFKHLNMINSLTAVENLFNAEKYSQVAEILKETFNGGPCPQVGRMGRPAQLGLLMHSLWFTDMGQCFVWTEECLYEAFEQHLKFTKDQEKWEKIVEKCLAILYEIIKRDTVCVIDLLTEDKRSRIVQTLSKIVSKQMSVEGGNISYGCITPWILLHYVLLREEQRAYAKKRISRGKKEKFDINANQEEITDNNLPPSIAILFSAHEFLGPKGWCMTNQGEILHFIIDTILDKLDAPIFEKMRNKIDIHIEQAMFCLYQHPSKKNKVSRHLADHNVDPLPLSWERATQLFEFYGPDQLPEFNSYKNASISADLEQLFKRIIALVPPNNAVQQHLPKIMDFIHGKTDKILDPVDFPRKVKPIYFLIGDFYFKQREFNKCIKYFQMDLCINPSRLDSWACLGLSYAAQLDTKLNHCEKFKSEMEFLDKAKYASICFKKALEICPDPLMLWIECGTFQYTVHAYCSRVLKYESENLSMERFEFLESQKNSYLDSSGSSFEKAIAIYEMEETNEADERWLQYYILGKIAEKKQKEPTEYLQYYLTAATLLDENKAEYPEKINYSNPQHLSVEALELHYRINASVLKYLELHEGKNIPNTLGAFFKKCLATSKYLRKPPPPPPPPTLPVSVPEQEPCELLTVSTSSTSFQEQFLNSLGKLGAAQSEKKDDEKIEKEQPDKELESVKNVDKKISENSSNKLEMDNKEKIDTKMETADEDDVIMIISDSEEEVKVKEKIELTNRDEAVEHGTIEYKKNADVDIEKIKQSIESNEINIVDEIDNDKYNIKEDDMKKDPPTKTSDTKFGEVTDVQKVLDEMMLQTMKETEENGNEMDSDVSGTEKVEEVTLKEEEDNDVEIVEIKNESTENVIECSQNRAEPIEVKLDIDNKAKKINVVVDGDADNRRISLVDSSSGSSSSSSSSDSSESDTDDDDDDSSSSSSSSSSDGSNEFMSNSEISHLIDKCVCGLETCIIRLTQNYKALYRLAHLYFYYKAKKDVNKCKQLLLSDYKCKDGTVVNGLFNDRKPNNFFNGIWRIPSTEIDRPGSLSAHMSRCLSLLMQILRNTNDNKTLIDLCVQLRRIPEPDKIYIKDTERMAFSEQAMTMCIQSLRSQIKYVSDMTNPQIAKLLQEIFKIHQRLSKHAPSKEIPFANLLVEVYKKFIKEKIPENVNVLDLAIKFCSQNKSAEKHRLQSVSSKSPMFVPRGPAVSSNAPVMPSPQTVTLPQSTLLKRPGVSRPRGRPPLQKTPGQPRYQRSKSVSSAGLNKTYAWQKSLIDQSYAYEYLKHYQDELIKQYSQNLSISQLTQLSHILTQGQINNPLTANAITSQMLAQTGLLNSNLLKQINSVGNVNTPSTSMQLMDTLNQLNPNMKKKLGVDHALSSLTSDQLKVLGTMVPQQSGAQHKQSTSSIASSSKSIKQSSSPRTNLPITSKQSTMVDPSKIKQTSINQSSPTKSISNQQIFKEPVINAAAHSPEEKTAKDLMKDRPNISIIPVAVPLPLPPPSISPSFMRQNSTSPSSGGKTLQEKLAEKKKEQQTKQLKSNGEGGKRQTEALMKSLNIPSLPSSLTVSPAQSSTSPSLLKQQETAQGTVFNFSKTPPLVNAKFPLDISMQQSGPLKSIKEPSLPTSLIVSRTPTPLGTPSFSSDSGVSISQVHQANQQKVNEEKQSPVSNEEEKTVFSPLNSYEEIKPKNIKSDSSVNYRESTKHMRREEEHHVSIPKLTLNSSIDISPIKTVDKVKYMKKSSKGSKYKQELFKDIHKTKHKDSSQQSNSKKLEESLKSYHSGKHGNVSITKSISHSQPDISFHPTNANSEKTHSSYGKKYSKKSEENAKSNSFKKLLISDNAKRVQISQIQSYSKSESSKRLENLSRAGVTIMKTEPSKFSETLLKSTSKEQRTKSIDSLPDINKTLEILSKSGVHLKTLPFNKPKSADNRLLDKHTKFSDSNKKGEISTSVPNFSKVESKNKTLKNVPCLESKIRENPSPKAFFNISESDNDDDVICID